MVWFSLIWLGFPGLDGYLSNFKSVFDDVKSKVDVVNVLIRTISVWFGYLGSNGYFRHSKSEFAPVKSKVGLLGQLVKSS